MDIAWRIGYEGGLYHVLSRGNEQKDIFYHERNLPIYLVRTICILSNEETGRLFGMTYSAISHILSSMRNRMGKDSDSRINYKNIYSLCKM